MNIVNRADYTADNANVTVDNTYLTVDQLNSYNPVLLNGNVTTLPLVVQADTMLISSWVTTSKVILSHTA